MQEARDGEEVGTKAVTAAEEETNNRDGQVQGNPFLSAAHRDQSEW